MCSDKYNIEQNDLWLWTFSNTWNFKPHLSFVPSKWETIGQERRQPTFNKKQVRLVRAPNHLSRSHARQGGPVVWGVRAGGGGGSSTTTTTQTWLHKADSTYSRAQPKKDRKRQGPISSIFTKRFSSGMVILAKGKFTTSLNPSQITLCKLQILEKILRKAALRKFLVKER